MKLSVNEFEVSECGDNESLTALSNCIIAQIKENGLTAHQALVMLEATKAKVMECKIS